MSSVSSARTEADLDQAARHFTTVMVSGVVIARALFTRSKGRGGTHEPSMVLRAKAKGGSGGSKKPGGGEAESTTPRSQGKQGRRPSDDDFKGGKKKRRDKDYGIKDPAFWSWWHRQGKKEYGGQDLTDDMMKEVYADWVARGRPSGGGDKWNKPRR